MRRFIKNKSSNRAKFESLNYYGIYHNLYLDGKFYARVESYDKAVKWCELYNYS